MHYSKTWDLDSIFAGGIDSPALTAKMSTIKQQLTTTADTLVHWRAAADTPDADWFTQLVNSLQAIQAGIDQLPFSWLLINPHMRTTPKPPHY